MSLAGLQLSKFHHQSFSSQTVTLYCRYVYEGYLYSSTVDFLAASETDMIYTWTLLVIGYILPHILILLSHLVIIIIYRNNNFDAWLARRGSRNNYVTNHRLQVGLVGRL